jgi:hypothetical protein
MYTETKAIIDLKYFSDPEDVIEKADKIRCIGDELLFLHSQKRAYVKAINAGAVNETYLYEMIGKVHNQINSLEEQLRKL